MASSNYFEEYTEFIQGLENSIMEIQFRYNECLNWVQKDFESGLLSEEDYKKLITARMDTYIPGYSDKYTLSMEDTKFISEVADVDNEGKVLSTFLKSKYLRKEQLLKDIFQAVRIFAYYDTFDFETRKSVFQDIVVKFYQGKLNEALAKKNSLENVYGDKVNNSSKYKETCENIKTINYNLQLFNSISNCTPEQLTRLIGEFYKIKYMFYEWYKKMSYKEEYENGFVYGEHLASIGDLGQEYNNSLIIQNNIAGIYKDITVLNRLLIAFLEKIGNIDINQFEEVQQSKRRFFKKVELNNKDKLFLLFKEIYRITGASLYIEQFDTEYQENKAKKEEEQNKELELNLQRCFDTYFSGAYEDAKYVEPDVFLGQFKRDLCSFYKKSISNFEKELEVQNRQLERCNVSQERNLGKSMRQANMISEIHNGYNGRESVTLAGFNLDELSRMYDSLKMFIINGFKFDSDEEKLKK